MTIPAIAPVDRPREQSVGGVVPEGVVLEGVVPEGVVPDGLVPEGVVPEGVVLEGVVLEGVVPEGVVPEGVVPEGVVLEGVVAEGVVAEGVVGVVGLSSQRCDTLKKNGVTFMFVLSMSVNGSLPSGDKFVMIRPTASFASTGLEPEGRVANPVRLATWKVTKM